MANERFKLIVAEKDDFMREKIAGLLSRHRDVRMVVLAGDFVSLEKTVREVKPDAVFIDAALVQGERDGVSALKRRFSGMMAAAMLDYEIDAREKKESLAGFDAYILKKDLLQEAEKLFEIIKRNNG